ncbi:hypothetical protein K474DRAFT_992047 [Panus rudis PR-1116 ss-1]|nr:hypothetical protein K474DRAFT_992047 [Panus rudis PR-1116 ss-1]
MPVEIRGATFNVHFGPCAARGIYCPRRNIHNAAATDVRATPEIQWSMTARDHEGPCNHHVIGMYYNGDHFKGVVTCANHKTATLEPKKGRPFPSIRDKRLRKVSRRACIDFNKVPWERMREARLVSLAQFLDVDSVDDILDALSMASNGLPWTWLERSETREPYGEAKICLGNVHSPTRSTLQKGGIRKVLSLTMQS